MQQKPQFQKQDFFIYGESYGGHYVPSIANRIHNGNKNLMNDDIHINLKGIGIGNGLTNPVVQVKEYKFKAYNFIKKEI